MAGNSKSTESYITAPDKTDSVEGAHRETSKQRTDKTDTAVITFGSGVVNITKSFVDSCQSPGKWKDRKLPGFGLRIQTTGGKKVYIVQAHPKNEKKLVTVTLGAHGVVTCDQARDKAKKVLAQLADGINPNELRQQEIAIREAAENVQRDERKVKEATLERVLEDYLKSRKLKANTAYGYRVIVRSDLKDWLTKPLVAIDKEMVERRHEAITEEGKPAHANHVMRILRALFTYAELTYEGTDGKPLVTVNPVKRLSQVKAWNRVSRRQSIIKNSDMKAWYEAVCDLENSTVRDYLLMLLFTGLRKNEAAQMKWNQVDFREKCIYLSDMDTKNHQPHALPLTGKLHDVLLERWQNRNEAGNTTFVYPSDNAKGHLVDVRWHQAIVTEQSGVEFMLHDLRRTFETTAERLDVSHYALKQLLNHNMSADVTAGYIVSDVERLRGPMDLVTAELSKHCGITQAKRSNKVVALKGGAQKKSR